MKYRILKEQLLDERIWGFVAMVTLEDPGPFAREDHANALGEYLKKKYKQGKIYIQFAIENEDD